MIGTLAAIVGPGHVLTGEAMAPYLTDWTGEHVGSARAVVRPAGTPEVARIVAFARDASLPLVLQGGNTSVAGGSVPGRPGGIVLSLSRLARIRAIDPASRTATAEAGVILQTLQERVAAMGLDYPLMFAARGTATIGGTLATNAGGANVLRHGNARDLCLGIEAVLPDGRIVNGLSGLRKDNTGYDLRHLLIGAEGTLGVITAAVLKLVPTPRVRATAFLAVPSLGGALDVLNILNDRSGGLVEAFEWLPGAMTHAILAHDPSLRTPLTPPPETGLLVELASTRPADAAPGPDGTLPLDALMIDIVSDLIARGLVRDGVFAASHQQRAAFWALREAVLETIRANGPFLVLDAALPLARVADFVARADTLSLGAGLRPMLVGHLGDGNIHYSVVAGPNLDWTTFDPDPFVAAMLDLIGEMGGTFSAEHGIGRSKAATLAARKDPAQLAAMRAIKRGLDPDNLFNPGVLFPDP